MLSKKFTLIGLLIGTLAVGMIIGGYIGARLTVRTFGMMTYAKPEVDTAANAAFEAMWLASLRLGDTNDAISSMENAINIHVSTLAVWDSVIPLDEKTRQARNNWLVPVKVYRQSYPANDSDMELANALLNTIPGRNKTNKCNSVICRLDELRLAKLRTATNSPSGLKTEAQQK